MCTPHPNNTRNRVMDNTEIEIVHPSQLEARTMEQCYKQTLTDCVGEPVGHGFHPPVHLKRPIVELPHRHNSWKRKSYIRKRRNIKTKKQKVKEILSWSIMSLFGPLHQRKKIQLGKISHMNSSLSGQCRLSYLYNELERNFRYHWTDCVKLQSCVVSFGTLNLV